MDTASAAEPSPPPRLRDAVKAEPSTENERGQQLQQLSRHQDVASSASALDFLALWRPSAVSSSRHAAALTNAKQVEVQRAKSSSSPPPSSELTTPTHVYDPRLGTLSIGSVVFAPYRVCSERPARGGLSACVAGGTVSGSPVTAAAPHQLMPPPRSPYRLHYALAEVTGIQVMAGTVTVSFLFTDPGIDDEAVSMYECVPCPPACLSRWLLEESSPAPQRCSLLERVLHVTPPEGPLPVNDVYRALHAASPKFASAPGLSPLLVQRQRQRERCVARLRRLYCLSDDDDEQPHTTMARNSRGVAQSASGEDMAAKPVALEPTAATATPSSAAWRFLSTATTEKAALTVGSAGTTTLAASAATMFARYVAPTSVHVFFSSIFQEVNVYMEHHCSRHRRHSLTDPTAEPLSSPSRRLRRGVAAVNAASPPPLVLVIFDSYATLRRFHVFMSVRGHVVQLLDGAHVDRALPSPQTSHAFGAQCKIWLCMLRDDTGEESVEEEAKKEDGFSIARASAGEESAEVAQAVALMEAQLRCLLAAAPPVDALVSFREHVTQQQVTKSRQSATLHQHVTAEAVLQRLMPNLGAYRLECVLQDVPAPPPRPTPVGNNAAASSSGTTQPSPSTAPATTVVKVSGAVFGDNKILVPCSPEQLTLLSTVLASTPVAVSQKTGDGGAAEGGGETAGQRKCSPTKKANRKRPRVMETADSSSATAVARAQALTPALLERIALGSFTDAAAATLFDVFADATAVVMKSPDPSSADLPATAGDAHRGSSDGRGAAEVLSSIEDLYEKWCVDPSRFGEAFPVFAAVYALVADVFASVSRFRPGRPRSASEWDASIGDEGPRRLSSGPLESAPSLEQAAEMKASAVTQRRLPTQSPPNELPRGRLGALIGALPRIALVLPRGNPTQHPNLGTQQYLRTLRAFFSPWAVHEVTSPAASVAVSCAAPVLWHQRGGLLLLFCDEATTQLGALQDEADVVIACGKAAAAWVAANSATKASSGDSCKVAAAGPLLFAVISEAEVVAPTDQLTHLWLPITLASPTCMGGGDAPADVSTSADGLERCSEWPAMSKEETSRTELEEMWRLLVATVSADGSVDVPARPSSPLLRQDQQQHGQTLRSTGVAARRLHQVEVLPRTLRQAVVLWRHLQTAEATVCGGQRQSRASPSELDNEGPWGTLQAVVKEMALSCVTATPVRMTDVTLLRGSDDSA
ncbi:conserved hypothetical protein [Leishmania infantum JPCM5]|uniref:Uncharacterized protein n=2 Tax=Leishmania infantum TaxID=5671 RepID=A4HXE7_LEIIN|nr:conserved hypothetical protein [Leishmania infantum JPCM5]CAC9478082.1 hypothetical_protein_-_conserved [Leishmania infantum]CAM59766.1 conserved hypothetical protein [Leishmania infantum JPCM5]SUZ40841.1 hypothetical_protein_-_conserved [Leishmania infantum]|eukprot:XP_001464738.1 conserved hypothetical protein [Leishmania infantum JPCM5]